MFSELEPYAHYEFSGVPRLGDVPAHWTIRRLKTCVANVVDQTDEHEDGEICLALEDVESWTGRYEEAGSYADLDSQAKRFRVGDVLFCKLRPYLAKVVRPNRAGICTGEFLVLRPSNRGVTSHYLEQLLRSRPVIDAIDASTFGAKMPGAEWQFIGGMDQPVPPLDEQTAIICYLGHVDQRIHRYIDGKQGLITLLEEQRQAVVHRAVTRGLDPNVRLKSSGVSWVGDVPAHWEMRRLKTYVENVVDQTEEYEAGEICLALEDVESWTGRYEEAGSYDGLDSQTKKFRVGDVLFCKLRPYLAKVIRPNRGGICVGEFLVLRSSDSSMTPPYLEQLLRSRPVIDAINASTFGARMPRADWQFIGCMNQPVPPVDEQVAIVEYLDKATADIDAATDRTHREIELMREYRERLIADVVTGKLDVRKAAERLPGPGEKADEPPPSGETEAHTEDGRRVSDHLAPSSEVTGA